MSDVLLRELSNADIDWLVQTGDRRQLSPADVLIRPDKEINSLYILLEGTLSISLPTGHVNPSATLNVDAEGVIATMSRGDLLGESWLFNTKPVVWVTAAEEAVVLAVPKAAILTKLHQDVEFAAHFYRVLALIMSERIRMIFEHPEKIRYGSKRLVKEALSVFGELRDSDIDWMISSGRVKKVKVDEVLLSPGRPVDALYTVLDGQLGIAISDRPCDPLSMCFQSEEAGSTANPLKTATFISRGGLPGIISFLDFQPMPAAIKATRETLILAIPRQKVAIKLQEDMGFASRFYRVICTQTINLLQTVNLLQSEISSQEETANSATVSAMAQDDGELNLDQLQQISHGGTKFDWMLRQLGVGCG